MTMTARAKRSAFAVGFAPQTAKGSAASSANAKMFAAESFDEDPQLQSIHPQGSTGSLMKKDTRRDVVSAPVATASFMGTRQVLGTILEMMCFGPNTVSNAQLTEANDTNNVLSSWALSGVRPGVNTEYTSSGAIVYVKIDTNVIYLYSDSAKTQLVAQGACTAGTVTLAAQNNSNLTGTVACTSATPANDAGITLTINTVSCSFANTPSSYWTMFIDDGKKLRTIVDCVMKSAKFTSKDRGPLMIDVVIWGMSRTVGATALTPSIPLNDVYAHNGDLAMRNALDSSPVTQQPDEVTFTFDRNCEAIFGTGSAPQDIYSKLIDCELEATFQPISEVDTLIALVSTFDSLDLKWTRSSKVFTITIDKAMLDNPKHPGFSGDDVGTVPLKWVVMEETASSPSAALTITFQP